MRFTKINALCFRIQGERTYVPKECSNLLDELVFVKGLNVRAPAPVRCLCLLFILLKRINK